MMILSYKDARNRQSWPQHCPVETLRGSGHVVVFVNGFSWGTVLMGQEAKGVPGKMGVLIKQPVEAV